MTDKIVRADSTVIGNVIRCTFKEQVNADERLRFGAVAAKSIEFEAFGAQSIAPSVGEVLTYYQVDGNGVDTLIGKFTARPSVPGKASYTVVAYDNITLLETDFSEHLASIQSNFPMTLNDLLGEVETVAGVTFGNAPTLGTTTIEEFSASGVSCRDVVSWAAEMSGQYVYADTSGNICFGWYRTASGYKIYKTSGSSSGVTYVPYKQDSLNYKDYAVGVVDGVAVYPPEVEGAAAIYPAAATGNLYPVSNNLLLSGASVATLENVAQTLYAVLSALPAYRPCAVDLFRFDNPLRAGDIVEVEDAQGVSFNTIVMSLTVNPEGAHIECAGRETYNTDIGSNLYDVVVNLAQNIVRINRLKVDWADINQAIINYLTANNVTAQNLTIVDENGTVLATYSGSGITLGEDDMSKAEFTNNSFQLHDKWLGSDILCGYMGTSRDSNGIENVTRNYTGDGSTTQFTLTPPYDSNTNSLVVKVNGSVVSVSSDYVFTNGYVQFLTPPAPGDVIEITYETTYGCYRYDMGTRTGDVGAYSFISGETQTASGSRSAVLGGLENKASGNQSVVLGGIGNKAQNSNQVVSGKYNAPGDYAEIVGNGSGQNSRSNARTLDWSGNETLAGTLYVNGSDEVATKSDFGAVTFKTNQITNGNSKTLDFGPSGGCSTVVFVTGAANSRMATIHLLCNTSGRVYYSVTGSSGITVTQDSQTDYKAVINNASGGTVYILVVNYRGNAPTIS